MIDVTQILHQIEAGDPTASEQLLPLVYEELRRLAANRMANERIDHTLQATALVHEAFIRLVDRDQIQNWDSRGHFFSAAAESMRRILVESARRKQGRRQNGAASKTLTEGIGAVAAFDTDPDLLLDLDDGLSRLAEKDPEAALLAKLRLFGGLSVSEAGKMLGMSRTGAYETWEFVRSWFAVHGEPSED